MHTISKPLLACLLLGASTTVAAAEEVTPVTPGSVDATAAPAPEPLPAPTSDQNPAPPVAEAALPPGGVVEQAGIGGEVGYGRAGVLELGGSAGLMLSSQFRNVTIAPSFGWFVSDNFELSAILSVSNVKAGTMSATTWSAIAEPSYHVPFNRTTFGFFGMGVGAGYENKMGAGLAFAPRVGAKFLVGSSGVLTPSLQYMYISHDAMTTGDATVVALTSAMSVNVGYTTMW